jgi:hypothetical protein
MADKTMRISLDISCQVLVTVPAQNRHVELAKLEAQCKTEFGEFSRHLMEQGIDALFRINERTTIRRDPERRSSRVDTTISHERRWDKRMQLLCELDARRDDLAKPWLLDRDATLARVAEIEKLLNG